MICWAPAIYSRPLRFCSCLLLSPFPLPSLPVEVPVLVPRSHSCFRPRPRPRFFLPVPGALFARRCDVLVEATVSCGRELLAACKRPPPVCRHDVECGITVPAVDREQNRRRRRAISVPSAICGYSRRNVSPSCAPPVRWPTPRQEPASLWASLAAQTRRHRNRKKEERERERERERD